MDNVYIGYNATIMPNVKIGSNVIVGAGALVSKDLEPNGVYVGVPAKRICSFDDYMVRHCENPDNQGGIPIPMYSIIKTYLRKRLRKPGSSLRLVGV